MDNQKRLLSDDSITAIQQIQTELKVIVDIVNQKQIPQTEYIKNFLTNVLNNATISINKIKAEIK